MSRHRKRPVGAVAFDWFNNIQMAVLCAICLLPLLHIICASFSEPRELLAHSGLLLRPLHFTTVGYQLVFSNDVIWQGYLNTIYYVVVGTALSTVLTIMGGYALSRRKLLWGNTIVFIITFTMFFNGGLIPFYILVNKLGLMDTRAAVILPNAVNTFNLIIMRTSMSKVPESLEESALIDGAGQLTIMWRIIVPVVKATIAVIVLFYAVGIWNSWFNAAIFLQTRGKYPLQLVLKEVLVANDASSVLNTSVDTQGKSLNLYKPLVKYCTIVIATLPVLCLYPFVQKYFVTGMMIGSIKG